MTVEQIKEGLLGFISDEIDIDDIVKIEYQCGGCWIELNNGKTLSLMLTETEE